MSAKTMFTNLKSANPIDQYIAIHEGVHRFKQWKYGYVLDFVSIIPGQREDGFLYSGIARANHPEHKGGPSIMISDDLSARTLFPLLAGRAGTDYFLPEFNFKKSYQDDFRHVDRILRRPDRLQNKILSWHANTKKPTAEKFYAEFKEEIFKKIKSKRSRRAILALASELIKTKILSGAESARILEEAYGNPLPKLALPVSEHATFNPSGPKTYSELLNSINATVSLLRRYIDNLRDSGTEIENKKMDGLADQLTLLKLITM